MAIDPDETEGTIHLDGDELVLQTVEGTIRRPIGALAVVPYEDGIALVSSDEVAWEMYVIQGDVGRFAAATTNRPWQQEREQVIPRLFGRNRRPPAPAPEPLTFVVQFGQQYGNARGFVGLRGNRVVARQYGLWDVLGGRRESWIPVETATVTIEDGWMRVSYNGAPWLIFTDFHDRICADEFAREVRRLRNHALGEREWV